MKISGASFRLLCRGNVKHLNWMGLPIFHIKIGHLRHTEDSLARWPFDYLLQQT
jgi:hypothetical protein